MPVRYLWGRAEQEGGRGIQGEIYSIPEMQQVLKFGLCISSKLRKLLSAATHMICPPIVDFPASRGNRIKNQREQYVFINLRVNTIHLTFNEHKWVIIHNNTDGLCCLLVIWKIFLFFTLLNSLQSSVTWKAGNGRLEDMQQKAVTAIFKPLAATAYMACTLIWWATRDTPFINHSDKTEVTSEEVSTGNHGDTHRHGQWTPRSHAPSWERLAGRVLS